MAGNTGVFLYVTEANSGSIRVLRMADNGELTKVQEMPVGDQAMPMAITPDHRYLFTATRGATMFFVGLAINGVDGTLSPTGSVPAPESTAYLSIDKSGR